MTDLLNGASDSFGSKRNVIRYPITGARWSILDAVLP
jgi:hypothetical protein